MKLVVALVVALTPEADQKLGFGVALPDREACQEAIHSLWDSLSPHYPQMEMRCVDTSILWESPIPRRRPE